MNLNPRLKAWSKLGTWYSLSPSYFSWKCMIARCHNPNASDFERYGGRGIKVCHRWRKSFMNFYEDMGKRPANKFLERVNNSGNYTLQNCKWADRYQQNNNKRTNVNLEFNGKRMTIAQWSRHLNIAEDTISKRLEHGWDISKALTFPVMTDRHIRATYIAKSPNSCCQRKAKWRHPKLTELAVLAIRDLKGTFSERDLSRRFSVSKTTINDVLNGRRWKVLEMPEEGDQG